MIQEQIEYLYKKAFMIRRIEEELEKLFSSGYLFGTIHGCQGQEIIPCMCSLFISIEKDFVTSTHRSHGHYLSFFEDPYPLIAELMGKNDGVVNGLGGSQHIYNNNFLTNGVTGGMIPTAVGISLGKRLRNNDSIVLSFLGDGGMNEGYVLESLNFAAVYDTPILFLLENNNYAMSTPVESVTNSDFVSRANGFGLNAKKVKGDNLDLLFNEISNSIRFVRNESSPMFLEIETYRFSGHSKSDDGKYRDRDLHHYWIENDPLAKLGTLLSNSDKLEIEMDCNEVLQSAFEMAKSASSPDPKIVYARTLT